MTDRRPRYTGVLVGATAAAVVLLSSGDLLAGPRKARRGKASADVSRIDTPLGLQGTRGAGRNVVIPFSLVDSTRRATDLEVEYGYDINEDGVISEADEYSRATEDRLDPRDTRKNKRPSLFTTAGDIGAAHAFVWDSVADIQSARFETREYQFSPQGRRIPDPNNPGEFLFAAKQAGVKVRMRAVIGKGRARKAGEWTYSEAFSLNNNSTPSMTIDAIVPNPTSTPTASDENVEVRWTGFDPDSEDANGNGVLDLTSGEDRDGDSGTAGMNRGLTDPIYDLEPLAVAFDYYRVQPGQDPATMSDDELATLNWQPATRAVGVGDTDSYPPGVPSSPVGRQYTFAWDSLKDVGTVNARFILRAAPFDVKRENGPYVYSRTPFALDNWKTFNTAGANSTLAAGRFGLSITNVVPGLQRSDPLYPAPFQTAVVAGGAVAPAAAGQSPRGTTSVDVLLINTETAETSTAQRVQFGQMTTARAFHSATRLDDGRILFAGGFDANGVPTRTTEIYDPASRSVQPGPDLLQARARHAAVRLSSGDVGFFGGVDASGAPLASAEVYHFTAAGRPTEANAALPNMATAQHSLSAVLLPDQRILVAAGVDAAGNPVTTAEALNPLFDADIATPTTKNPRFEPVGAMRSARKAPAVVGLSQGHVLFSGGSSLATMELFNWETSTFEPVNAPMPDGPRAEHLGTLLGDGSVLLAGGRTDASVANAPVVPAADVFFLGTRDAASGSWSGSYAPVNGDMKTPRSQAQSTAIMNGRVFVAGGIDAAGAPVAAIEVYTPERGSNARPAARVSLPSNKQSWAFGAPIYYRLSDPEADPARVVVQWSNDGQVTWQNASPQADTIGGDVAEGTAGLATALVDNEAVTIDPVARNTPGDHIYIWAMSRDIPRPPPGTSVGGYNIRVIPYGAVQGEIGVSEPVEVLYNTKIVPTILPMENRVTGVPQSQQGGDILIWTHLRDVDGVGTNANGDPASVAFDYAVDANNDGQIRGDDNEFWFPMTPSGAPAAGTVALTPYPQVAGAQTYSESAQDSDPAFGQRPASKGWTKFDWDSVYDLGAPATSVNNVWLRVTPYDADEGFPRVLRNRAGQPEELRLVRDPDALWLSSFSPRGGNKAAVKPNEPIDFLFNGVVAAGSVTAQTFQIYRGASRVEGVFVTTQTGPRSSTVTFFPQPQNTTNDAPFYSVTSNPTVLFPFNEYRFRIPGYVRRTDPKAGTMIRPAGATFPAETRTFRLVQNVPIDGDEDAQYRFTTTSGHFDDGVTPTRTTQFPTSGGTLPSRTSTFSLSFNHAIDSSTVKWTNGASPGIRVTGDQSAKSGPTPWVVPGRWSVTNTVANDGTTTSTATFTPLHKYPSDMGVVLQSGSGLLGTNGRPVSTFSASYSTLPYGRVNASQTETFTTDAQNDTAVTTAAWAIDPCTPGVVTGLQDGSTTPQGGSDLTVNSGQTVTISVTPADYNNITVNKGGTLIIRASSAATIRAKGNVTINGLVTFAGDPGYSGQQGLSTQYYYLTAAQTAGTRAGGVAYNGGGSGADSVSSSANSGQNAGSAGFGSAPGAGGNVMSSGGASISYGAGGGAGGGHGTRGLDGGSASPYATLNFGNTVSWGGSSVGGSVVGSSTFTAPTAGSGGGSGGTNRYSSNFYHQGGAGGAGAGAVTFLCDGAFTVGPSGYVDGSGGAGGAKAHGAGAGGGGSGGGLHIKSGGLATLDGIIDLRGGRGGPNGFGYFSDFYAFAYADSYGSARFGGDGGLGRLMVEAPNMLAKDEVRVFGQMMVRKITSIPTSSVATAVAPHSAFTNGGTVPFGSTKEVRYTSLTIPASRTVTLTGTSAVRIFVDGDIDIQGKIVMNGGGQAQSGVYTTDQTSPYAGGHWGFTYMDSTVKGYAGTLGGGQGGDPHGQPGTLSHEASDGRGPSFGKHLIGASSGWSNYYSGDSGGGGGGNASAGRDGWAPYAALALYNYVGATANDSTGKGILSQNGGAGGARLDPSTLTSTALSTLDNFVGSGGGGGNSGGYYNNQYGMAGTGGAGGGALAIITPKKMTFGAQSAIEARGGDGNQAGAAAIYVWTGSTYTSYNHAGGGGGSGGTVYLIGDEISIAKVNVGEGVSKDGATFDMAGGMGGGYRTPLSNGSGILVGYPSYDSFGNFGGDGGYGRLIIDYKTSLNGGRTLVNRWGMEQSVFHDAKRQYRALAGSFSTACRGAPKSNLFQSKWYDLGSLRPIVNGASALTTSNVGSLTFQGQGAQSHPHNPGAGGTGEADPGNISALVNSAPSMLDGWRFFRFRGTFTRGAGSTVPTVDNVQMSYVTDSN